MAQSLVIRNQCDACLAVDKVTPADTYRIDLRVLTPALHVEAATPARPEDNPAPFLVELCPEHGAAVCDAVLALVPLGRPDDSKDAPAPAVRARQTTPTDIKCPACSAVYATVGSLRGHARKEHGKSLAGVGFYPANFTCPTCKDAFPNRQGMAVHIRAAHPNAKQSA